MIAFGKKSKMSKSYCFLCCGVFLYLKLVHICDRNGCDNKPIKALTDCQTSIARIVCLHKNSKRINKISAKEEPESLRPQPRQKNSSHTTVTLPSLMVIGERSAVTFEKIEFCNPLPDFRAQREALSKKFLPDGRACCYSPSFSLDQFVSIHAADNK